MRKLKSKGGFTLVELMIVVVILGILVAIAVPIFGAVTKNAEKKTCYGNADIIEKAASQYLLNHDDMTLEGIFKGGYPAGGAKFSTQAEAESAFTAEFLSYFDGAQIPLCPNGEEYTVTLLAENENRAIRVTCAEHGSVKE